MRVELLLDHSLRPGLLSSRLMLSLKLDFAEFADITGTFLTRFMILRLRLGMNTVSHSLLA